MKRLRTVYVAITSVLECFYEKFIHFNPLQPDFYSAVEKKL